MFRQRLHETEWAEIETPRNPNVCYKIFWGKFWFLYDEYFPIKSRKLKTTDIESPCIAIEIKKPSKHKQSLYEKLLKTRTKKAEKHTKIIKIIRGEQKA